ncbi:hypothetical protein LCGC14_3035950, partial [marine sediment metagenome]
KLLGGIVHLTRIKPSDHRLPVFRVASKVALMAEGNQVR